MRSLDGFFMAVDVRPQVINVNNQRGDRSLAGDVSGDCTRNHTHKHRHNDAANNRINLHVT